MVSGWGSGPINGQVTSVSGAARVRLCGYVKRSSLNSADYLEFPDRTVARSGPAEQALLSASCDLANPSIQKVNLITHGAQPLPDENWVQSEYI